MAVPSAAVKRTPSLLIRIEGARLLPGVQPRSIIVPFTSLSASGWLHDSIHSPTSAKTIDHEAAAERRRLMERSKILTLPFRQAAYFLRRGFRGLGRLFTDEGFIFLKISQTKGIWKYDKFPAWAMENGKVLDSLVRHDLKRA